MSCHAAAALLSAACACALTAQDRPSESHSGSAMYVGLSTTSLEFLPGPSRTNGLTIGYLRTFNNHVRLYSVLAFGWGKSDVTWFEFEGRRANFSQSFGVLGAGPEFTARKGRATFFVHAAPAFAIWDLTAATFSPFRATGLSVVAGGGLEVHLTHGLAARLFEVNWIPAQLHRTSRSVDYHNLPTGWRNGLNISASLIIGQH